MRQIGPKVGVSFEWETPTPGQNPDSGRLQLYTPGYIMLPPPKV